MRMRRTVTALLLLLALGSQAAAIADEFRIETKVFAADEPEPVSRNTTLFRAGVVYDFLENPTQIAVLKKPPGEAAGRLILLNPSRRERTELSTDQILKVTSGLKVWAAGQNDPLLKFAADPKFRRAFDEATGKLELESDTMKYQVETIESKSANASRQYRDFVDWYSRISSILHPGSLPPFPRLMVNASLTQHQRIPSEIHLTIPAQKGYRREDLTMRSEHSIWWRLSKQDRKRIDQAGEFLVTFKEVDLDEFLRVESVE